MVLLASRGRRVGSIDNITTMIKEDDELEVCVSKITIFRYLGR